MKAIHSGKAKNDKIDSYKIANLLKDSQYNLPAQSLNLKNISARESLQHHYDD